MSEPAPETKTGRRRGLGMGLSALLGSGAEALEQVSPSEGVRRLPIELLRPSGLQPRRHFPEAELGALAESIRTKGIMQPLLVRQAADDQESYEIIAGERRWRAAQLAGLHELPVVVHALSDRDTLEVALIENVQRQDLSPLEEAEGYRRLIDEFGHTQEALGAALGKSRSHIANLMRLLGLPDEVRTMLAAGELSAGHARALIGTADPLALARTVVARGLNVRQTEALVRADSQRRAKARQAVKDADTRALERDLSTRLGMRVKLQRRGAGGTLSLSFRSLDQLDGLLRRFA